jgi:hypothetical protein
MNIRRFRTKALALVLISFAVAACQTSYRAIRPGSEIDAGTGYVVMRFRGPDANVSLVELTERTYRTMDLRDTDKLQLVPLPAGDYAVTYMSGTRGLLATFFLGSAKFYFQIPLDLMRVIRVRPGTAVYIGELDIRRTVDLNPFVDGRIGYSYDLNQALPEFTSLYDPAERLTLVGFQE